MATFHLYMASEGPARLERVTVEPVEVADSVTDPRAQAEAVAQSYIDSVAFTPIQAGQYYAMRTDALLAVRIDSTQAYTPRAT